MQCCWVPGRDKQRACGSQTRPLRGDRKAETAPQPALGSCSYLMPKCAGGTQSGAQSASVDASATHAVCTPRTAWPTGTSPCRCRPPPAECTVCTPHSSTSAPGTGRAVSPPGSVCYGHARSRCSHSSSRGGTCGPQCLERSGQPGRNWVSRPSAPALVYGAVGHHLCSKPGPWAERWHPPHQQPH